MTIKNILITGSSGFVGINLIKYLRENTEYELFTPSRRELDLLNPPPEFGGNISDNVLESIVKYLNKNKIDTIIHLAATVAGLPGNIGNQGLFMYENLQMGINILEAARLTKVQKIINLLSVCGYHDIGPKPFKEENFWNGLPHESNRGYGLAKRAIAMMGIEYERQYGMNITNLLPINLVGPYDRSNHVIIDLIKKFENPRMAYGDLSLGGIGDDIPVVELWGTGKATREFVDVMDLCRAIEISLQRKTGAWPINIGTGREISIKDLAELIKKIGEYEAEIDWDTEKPEGQGSRQLDITKAKEILRWQPTISLEESIKRTIEWYRNEIKILNRS